MQGAWMSDGLPGLLPDDPQNLLSREARKRIQRALIEGDTFIWEAEAAIETQSFNRTGITARRLRNEANFKKAKAFLSAYRTEFSQLSLSDQQYRKIMKSEIEAASDSLQLYGSQRRLLETEFFFQEEQPAKPSPSPSAPKMPAETIAAQIERLRAECRLTVEDLAEALDVEPRSVYRHLSGKTIPRKKQTAAYEKLFSKHLGKQTRLETSS
jgi:DNA-binding XRE family transcriptional regulator